MTDRIAPADWNGWELDKKTPALVYQGPRNIGYQIDLTRMLTRDQFGWWVIQIYSKGWGSDFLTGFVTAVDDVLDPHSHPQYTADDMRWRVANYRPM